MRSLLATLLLLIVSAVHAGQGAEYVNSYFENWLKAHGFNDFEKRKDGIYFPRAGVLLDGEIHEAKELAPGKFYSVESRISIAFKNGRRLDDYVAGAGTKADEAFHDSLQNFCLTTLHSIYAELFQHKDPHVRKATWKINRASRRVFLSEWGQRGTKLSESVQVQVEKLLAEELQGLSMSPEIHWVKLVVLINEGKLQTLVVTLDGVTQEGVTQRLAAYNWPSTSGFSMAKLFLVIGGV
jgi:hypothetical protein